VLPYLWGGWTQHLTGPPPKQKFMAPGSFKFIRSLGYLPPMVGNEFDIKNELFSIDGTTVNKWYNAIDPEFKLCPDLTHSYVKTNWSAMEKQFRLFDLDPECKTFPRKQADWAYQQVKQMFEVADVKSEVIPLEKVEWNFEASSGYMYQKLHGKKGKFLMTKEGVRQTRLFWAKAHKLKGCRVLWKVSGKEEYLPWKKIYNNDQRCFEIPDVMFLSYALRCVQKFNKKLYAKYNELPIKIGASFQKGGLDRLLRRLEKKSGKNGMGDCTKWDKHFNPILREYCKRLRVDLFDGTPEMSKEEFSKRMDFIYQQCVNSAVIMPWGQVLEILTGMKSGDPSTSVDNSIGHLIIVLAMIKYHFPHVQTYKDALAILDVDLYADDQIFSTEASEKGDFLSLYETRRDFYSLCGFVLKEDDDKVEQSTWEGLSFLGASITRFQGSWVPKFNLNRIWSSIVFDNYKAGKRTPLEKEPVEKALQYYSKLYNLCVLSTFNGREEFNKIRLLLVKLIRLLDHVYGPDWTQKRRDDDIVAELFTAKEHQYELIPSFEWAVSFWTGWESLPSLTTLEESSCLDTYLDTQKLEKIQTGIYKLNRVNKFITNVLSTSNRMSKPNTTTTPAIDSKGIINHWAQQRNKRVLYSTQARISGGFCAKLSIDGEIVSSYNSSTKSAAEQGAAQTYINNNAANFAVDSEDLRTLEKLSKLNIIGNNEDDAKKQTLGNKQSPISRSPKDALRKRLKSLAFESYAESNLTRCNRLFPVLVEFCLPGPHFIEEIGPCLSNFCTQFEAAKFEDTEESYASVLAEVWGKLMHAANGNIFRTDFGRLAQQSQNRNPSGSYDLDCDAFRSKLFYGNLDHIKNVNKQIVGDLSKVSYFTPLTMESATRKILTVLEQYYNFKKLKMKYSNLKMNRPSFDKFIEPFFRRLTQPPEGLTMQQGATFEAARAESWNRLMHSLNGNQSMPQRVPRNRPSEKAHVKQVAKEEAKILIDKVARNNKARKRAKQRVAKQTAKLAVKMQQVKPGIQNKISAAREAKYLQEPAMKAEVKNVVLNICAPCTSPTERFVDEYTGEPTTTAKPTNTVDVAWPSAGTTVTGELNPNEMFGALYRDVARNAVLYDSNTNNETSRYDANFVNDPSSTTIVGQVWMPNEVGENLYPQIAYFSSHKPQNWEPHGSVLGSGKGPDGINGIIYANAGDTFKWDVTGTLDGTHQVDIVVEKWEGENFVMDGSVPAIAGPGLNTLGPFSDSAYRRWFIRTTNKTDAITDFTTTFYILHQASCFAHLPIPDVFENGTLVSKVRILGASIMYSNKTAALTANGTVAMTQTPKGVNFDDWTNYKKIVGVPNHGEFDAKKGIYGFLKPSGEIDYDMQDFSEYTKDVLTWFGYNLVPKSPLLVIFIVVESTDLLEVGKWTICNQFEYETSSRLVETIVAQGDPDVFRKARIACKSVPQFHENPFHLKDIFGAATKVADAIVKYAPIAADWAGKISTFLSSF